MSRFGAVPLFPEEKHRFGAVPVDAPEKPEKLNPGLGIARDLVEGIPVVGPLIGQGSDFITSEIIGRVTGEDPAALREGYTSRKEQFREEHPILSGGAQLAGAVAATAPLAATSLGAKAFGLTQNSMLARGGMGLASGATLTGADSLVRHGDPERAMYDAAAGGAVGAVASGAAPYIARGVDAVVQGVGRAINPMARDAATGYSRPATQAVVRAMTADDTLGNLGAQSIARGGPDAMLADAGPNARGLLDTVIQRGGRGANIATRAVEGRASQAADDINRALDQSLGPPQGVQATETAMRRGTAAGRDHAYRQAYASPIDYSSEAGRHVEALLPRVPQGVVGLANRMMQMEGQKSAQIMAQIADDGSVVFTSLPDVRQLDYITRALNQAAKSGEGQGALGGMTDIGRIYANLAREIRDTVRSAVPAYDRALNTAAQPIQAREALRFGEGLLKSSLTRDEAREVLEAMTGPQLEAARQGVRSHIDDVLANVRAVASDPNLEAKEARKALQDLSSRAAREKIAMLLDDPAAAGRLFAQLGQASRALELRAGVATNSKTFARMAMDRAIDDSVQGGIGGAIMRGETLGVGKRAVQAFFGRTPQDELAMSDKIAEEIAQMMTGPRADEAISLLSALANRSARP